MKKNLSSFGTALSREEAKNIIGGVRDGGGGEASCSTVARVCCKDADCGTDCTCYHAPGTESSLCVTPWN